MAEPNPNDKKKKKKGVKHWALFALRWGIAVVGVWYVLAHMSIRDQAWVILDHATNRPQQVSLAHSVPEDSATFPVIETQAKKIIDVPRADVVNEPDQSTVQLSDGTHRKLLAYDLVGDLNHHARVRQFLVEDPVSHNGLWIGPEQIESGEKYEVKVPHPRDQIGLQSMIRDAKPWLFCAAILVFPITFIVTSYRWNELLKALEIHIGQGRTFVLTMMGAFYNTFMPGSTGGDLLKAYYASKQTPHRMRAVMSVLVDRAIGLLALIIVGGIAAATQWEIPACKKVALASLVICFCVLVGLLVFYNPTLHRLSGLDFILRKLPMQKHVRNAVDAMHMYGKHPWLAIWTVVVSFPVHSAVVTSAMFAGMAFGLPLHWAYYWVCVPVIVLAGAIPISPQGAGVMEAFAVLLTRRQSVTVSQAFALTMSIRLVQVLWNLTGGIFILRGGYHAPGEAEKKELDEDEEGAESN